MIGSTEQRIFVYGMFQTVSYGESGTVIQNLRCLSKKRFMNSC